MIGSFGRPCCDVAGEPCSVCLQRFRRLWDLRPRIERYLRRRGARAELADDTVSDTYLVAWRRLHDVPTRDDEAAAWLCGVARRALRDRRRATHRRVALRDKFLADYSTVSNSPENAHPGDLRLAAVAAFDTLARSERDVVVLTGMCGLRPEQRVSWGAVSRRFASACHVPAAGFSMSWMNPERECHNTVSAGHTSSRQARWCPRSPVVHFGQRERRVLCDQHPIPKSLPWRRPDRRVCH